MTLGDGSGRNGKRFTNRYYRRLTTYTNESVAKKKRVVKGLRTLPTHLIIFGLVQHMRAKKGHARGPGGPRRLPEQ